MTLADLEFLTSAAGQALLHRLTQEDLREARTLTLLSQLRREYTPQQAGAALELARVRQKARDKFGAVADQLYFTRDALEQASDFHIRHYRAQQHTAAQSVLDVCCGIGADALAFAAQGAHVVGLDIDPLRLEIARRNADILGVADRATFSQHDVTGGLPDVDADLIFFDPARRDAEGKRIYDVNRYLPPLSLVKTWLNRPKAPQISVKLSPGVDLDQLRAYGGEVAFISVDGDLKEAVLHLTPPYVTESQTITATLITPDGAASTVHHWRRTMPLEQTAIQAPQAWLVEPDAAILRAGLVQDVAQALDGTLLDETIAYFTTAQRPESVWVRAWQVLDWMPFNLKKLRAYLRAHDVGRVTVKKRGSPLTPEQLTAQLKLKSGDGSRTLVLTRLQGAPVVLICADYDATGAATF